MRATVDLIATFDYGDEVEYAETLVNVMDRVRELCRADIVGPARRADGQASDGHIAPTAEPTADPLSARHVRPSRRSSRA